MFIVNHIAMAYESIITNIKRLVLKTMVETLQKYRSVHGKSSKRSMLPWKEFENIDVSMNRNLNCRYNKALFNTSLGPSPG